MNQKDITYFNIYELFKHARNDLAGILCLLYAQTSCYSELSSKGLMRKLCIHHIPHHIFREHLFVQSKTRLSCNYKTVEPQAYIRNISFLFTSVPAREKVVYLKALSMRKISENANFIPKAYFPEVKPNNFLTIRDDIIEFPLEYTQNH